MLMEETIEQAQIFFNWLLTRVTAWQVEKQDGVDRVLQVWLRATESEATVTEEQVVDTITCALYVTTSVLQ